MTFTDKSRHSEKRSKIEVSLRRTLLIFELVQPHGNLRKEVKPPTSALAVSSKAEVSKLWVMVQKWVTTRYLILMDRDGCIQLCI